MKLQQQVGHIHQMEPLFEMCGGDVSLSLWKECRATEESVLHLHCDSCILGMRDVLICYKCL